MAYLMGIDIGTSATKTVIFDETGSAVASALSEYPLSQPHPGWAEQDPEDWWSAVCKTVRDCIAKSGLTAGDIGGIGLSGQMHGLVMLDTDGKVLRPAILWCDQRTAQQCEDITRLVGRQRLIEITANPAMTGFTASKLLWVRENEPQVYEKCAKVLLPKDYIRYRLTGEFATEVSDASGMQLLDVPKRQWSDEVLRKLGVDRSLLAHVTESAEVSGQVSRSGAMQAGLSQGTPVAGGAGDQAAGAVGAGIVQSGIASVTIGTSGVVFAHTDRITIDPAGRIHTLCHAVPGMWHVMGVTQAAGLSLKWFRDEFCAAEVQKAAQMGTDPYQLMDAEANRVEPGCGGLLYLPYLMGERSPHPDPDAKGVFFGLTARHSRSDMLRAVMEGVAYSLKDCMEVITQMGIPVEQIRAAGGGAKSVLWRQMIADMFGNPLVTVATSEGPALGAALLAGVGTGVFGSVAQACEAVIRCTEPLQPGRAAEKVYQDFYRVYARLYPALREEYTVLSEILSEQS